MGISKVTTGVNHHIAGADPGLLKRGSILGLQVKQGGPGGGPILEPMLKSLHSGPRGGGGGGGSGPPGPGP